MFIFEQEREREKDWIKNHVFQLHTNNDEMKEKKIASVVKSISIIRNQYITVTIAILGHDCDDENKKQITQTEISINRSTRYSINMCI